MNTYYIEYELDDGTSVLIATTDKSNSGIIPVSRDNQGQKIIKANRKFGEALDSVKAQALEVRKKLEDLRSDEVELKFSLSTTLEGGNFVIGKIGIEAAYEVTLKWKNK